MYLDSLGTSYISIIIINGCCQSSGHTKDVHCSMTASTPSNTWRHWHCHLIWFFHRRLSCSLAQQSVWVARCFSHVCTVICIWGSQDHSSNQTARMLCKGNSLIHTHTHTCPRTLTDQEDSIHSQGLWILHTTCHKEKICNWKMMTRMFNVHGLLNGNETNSSNFIYMSASNPVMQYKVVFDPKHTI